MGNKPKKGAKRLLLLDGNAIIHRAYHGLPPLTTKGGVTVHAVYGFALTLLSVLDKFKPEYVAASFDLEGGTFRDELYTDYKAHRVAAPDDLYAQIPPVKELVTAFGIPIYERAGFEADDCVGTLAKQAEALGLETIIVTGDSDTLQLVNDATRVFTMRRSLKDTVLYDEAGVVEKYGFKPKQLVDYKGLAGDSSDNIPGVSGVGQKTATDLIAAYGDLEGIYNHLDDIKESVRKKLIADRDQAFLSRELGTIKCDVPVTLSLEAARLDDYDREAAAAFLQKYEFYSLLKRLPGSAAELAPKAAKKTARKKPPAALADASAVLALPFLAKEEPVACFITRSEQSLFGSHIESVELSAAAGTSQRILWNDETKGSLSEWLQDADRPKVFFDAKEAMHLFDAEGIPLAGILFDVSIAAYLAQVGGERTLESLVQRLEIDQDEPGARLYGAWRKLDAILQEIAEEQGGERTVKTVLSEIELPLIPVLFAMEKRGIILNQKTFQKMSGEMARSLEALAKDIYAIAGREFNINSTRQLAEVLFEDLQIPSAGIKRTKTGFSTASSELQKLHEYPIAQKIEEYRELFKLKSTYLDALPHFTDPDSRLHTTYSQTVAATGRLSSLDPNLQNIPIRGKWGESVRSAFEAAPGCRLIGADYSQIELRIMAHLSGDKALVEAFRRGEDVHRTTASAVFKVKPQEVTDDMRRQAKVFNFGLMYGMGAFGLSQAAGIDQAEAKEFIALYFEKFKGVRRYIDRIIKETKKQGYQETELGRRRLIPEIQSGNVQVQRAGERIAVNMPIQGMEADVVKIGMLRVQEFIDEKYAGKAHMLLQVHDELIFEVEESAADAFAREIGPVMEGAYDLTVPIVVDVNMGKTWGDI